MNQSHLGGFMALFFLALVNSGETIKIKYLSKHLPMKKHLILDPRTVLGPLYNILAIGIRWVGGWSTENKGFS